MSKDEGNTNEESEKKNASELPKLTAKSDLSIKITWNSSNWKGTLIVYKLDTLTLLVELQ